MSKTRNIANTPLQNCHWKFFHKTYLRNWQLYVMFLLPLIWFLVFRYWPMYGAQIAFRRFRMGDTITGAEFVGLANIKKFLTIIFFGLSLRIHYPSPSII